MDDDTKVRKGSVGERLAAVEAAIEALRYEVRTRRLVVADQLGVPRITAEVLASTAEIKLEDPDGGRDGTSVLVFSSGPNREFQLPGGGGIQLWRGGSAVGELASWADAP